MPCHHLLFNKYAVWFVYVYCFLLFYLLYSIYRHRHAEYL
nr:MAG TPA: chitin synthase regulator [Bacteriophage sp.]